MSCTIGPSYSFIFSCVVQQPPSAWMNPRPSFGVDVNVGWYFRKMCTICHAAPMFLRINSSFFVAYEEGREKLDGGTSQKPTMQVIIICIWDVIVMFILFFSLLVQNGNDT